MSLLEQLSVLNLLKGGHFRPRLEEEPTKIYHATQVRISIRRGDDLVLICGSWLLALVFWLEESLFANK